VTAPRGLTAAVTALFDAPPTSAVATPRATADPNPSPASSGMLAGEGTKPRRTRKPAKTAVPDISENQFLANIRELATLTGWELYHTHDSRRSDAGWPDLVCASARQRRTLFVELKKRTGTVSAAQEKWLGLLAACGLETAVWRPADMPEITKILRGQRIGGEG
jgi:VRR-NUC domain